MKRAFFRNRFDTAAVICAAALVISVIAGSLSAVFLDSGQNIEVYQYLNRLFSSYGENIDKTAVCRRSLEMNMRIFIPLVMTGMFFFGPAAAALCVALKGFVWGFCGGIYIKYYGTKGILISLVSFPSYIIVICAAAVFAGCSAELCAERDKKQAMIYYMMISIIFLVILSLAALLDGFASCPAISAVISVL